ncbi:MAG TPA: hypothetical protein VK636_15365 [Gemmatimonadaceae bacterium]|nr:hypothetical protein [Gemmatimonadaceae bacterium]
MRLLSSCLVVISVGWFCLALWAPDAPRPARWTLAVIGVLCVIAAVMLWRLP